MSKLTSHVEQIAEDRRTVHKYLRSDIDPELITRALGAALLAPNHRQTNPWQFVVVGRSTRAELAERVFELKKLRSPDVGEEQRQAGLESFVNPAGLVVFAQLRATNEFQSREDYATICCSIQNFSLCLAEWGFGTKWSTAAFITDPQVYQILGLDSEQVEIVGFVWLGHAAGPLAEQHRPFLSDVLKVLP